MTAPPTTQAVLEAERDDESAPAFEVHLANFEGPFDLLLTLIAKHKLDVTEVALSKVTDEFIAYISAGARSGAGGGWDLDETSEFLVIASTLLDLKAARLLPRGEVEDEDDLALLEARDLLFARLLQYKAFKDIAAELSARLAAESLRFPRAVGLEQRFADLLPEVVVGLGPHELAQLAAKVLAPKPVPTVALSHLHQPRVSVREEALVVIDRLRRSGVLTFRTLAADCASTLHVVARFLSLLELYRERAVAFEQVTALGELTVRWTGDEDDAPADLGAEFDDAEAGPPSQSPSPAQTQSQSDSEAEEASA